MYSSGVRVGHGWATVQGARCKGAPPYLRLLINRNIYLLLNSLKAKKIAMVATLIVISFNKWLFHYILCLFSYGFELQLGGAIETSPRALVVLNPALYIHTHILYILNIFGCTVLLKLNYTCLMK